MTPILPSSERCPARRNLHQRTLQISFKSAPFWVQSDLSPGLCQDVHPVENSINPFLSGGKYFHANHQYYGFESLY